MTTKLLRPLPPDRTYHQILNHYLVEKSIADRLRIATRDERKDIYANMYDELFRRVPDHTRLTQREDEELTRAANLKKWIMVKKFLSPENIVVEFAPGDCKFALQIAPHAKQVYAVDISNQMSPEDQPPENFELILYDGYHLDQIPKNSVDLVFSDQFLEHLHPEDTSLHFQLVNQILKPGGKYIFRTPHLFSGPHDISRFFCEEPQGFHLKEWTYTEFRKLLSELNFSQIQVFKISAQKYIPLPATSIEILERILKQLPKALRIKLARKFLLSINIVAIKGQ